MYHFCCDRAGRLGLSSWVPRDQACSREFARPMTGHCYSFVLSLRTEQSPSFHASSVFLQAVCQVPMHSRGLGEGIPTFHRCVFSWETLHLMKAVSTVVHAPCARYWSLSCLLTYSFLLHCGTSCWAVCEWLCEWIVPLVVSRVTCHLASTVLKQISSGYI